MSNILIFEISLIFVIFNCIYYWYNVMKILVVAAMPFELKAIKEWIKSANLKEKLDIDYLCCGIWNYETISSLEHYLTENKEPTFIRNIGICGYWNQKNELKSEPIQVASVINIHTQKEMIIPPFLQIAPLKNCFCSENVVYKKPDLDEKEMIDAEMYFDMESRWIEFIASKIKYPRLILKVPFDFINSNDNIKEKDYKNLSQKMFKVLSELPYYNYLNKILNRIK